MTDQELLDPLLHLLEIKSVSTQEKYIDAMAEARHFLVDLFKQMGFKTKILKVNLLLISALEVSSIPRFI